MPDIVVPPASRSSRRRLLRRAAQSGAALLAAPLLAGCQRRSATRLRFWAMGREGEVVGTLLEGFRIAYPKIDLRIEQLPFSAAHEKLLTAFAGNATPDVAQLGNTWIPELAALGALEDLGPAVTDLGLDPADHFEGIWKTNVIDGVLRGLPWYVDTRLLFVRRDLFERAGVARIPTDWPAFVQALDALKRRAGMPHPFLLPLTETDPLLAMALQQGDPLLRDGDRYGNFRSAGFQRALGFYLERFRTGDAPYLTGNQIANLWQEFGRGSFAAFISGPWNIGELDRRLPANLKTAWTTAPLPAPAGMAPPGGSTAGGSSLVVFRRSALKREAVQMLAWLCRPEVQLRFHALTGNLPPRRSTWQRSTEDGTRLIDEPRAAAFARQLERAIASPAVPEWERILQEMQLHAMRAQHAGTPVPEVCRALDERVDAFLEKRRWMLDRASNIARSA